MRIVCKFIISFAILLISLTGYAQTVEVRSVHYWTAPQRARMMIDVSSMPEHRIEVLDNPARLEINIQHAQLNRALNQPSA
ncbi:MAG: N-acetylmuramoyl-L-alanine amidase, partial [Gammaproteobacteria bacterium]